MIGIAPQEWKTDLPEFCEKTRDFYAGKMDKGSYKGFSGRYGSYAQKGGAASMLRLRMTAGCVSKEKLAFIAKAIRESLDCALALEELVDMGVENIITFDAHDPRVQNAIPLKGFETVQPIYQFIKYLLKNEKELEIDSDHMMVISPDEGGMSRAVFFSNVLGLDMGMFYKRRDYTRIVNGRNPIVAHEFLGSSVEGKDVLIIDDMISSGESMLDVAKELKSRKARKVFVCATFGLFTNGLQKFDEYYENGLIDRVLTTNLVYQTPELLSRPYYISVDMSKYIALIIDNLNHDASLSELLNPTGRINKLLAKYRAGIRD